VKKITLGFSPCPNDTFIFDALVNKRITTGNFHFEPVLADVEQLNIMAAESKLDITKISLGAYARVSQNYLILDSGSALGKGVGPLLVSKKFIPKPELAQATVAIPGLHTTANLLLSTFYPEIENKTECLFSEIENQVLSGKVDAGLLIHEGRFTYEKKGLTKIADLGELWESAFHVPLPLGCIAASRSLNEQDRFEISDLIQQSISYGYAHPEESKLYIRQHAQEMEESVIQSHITLYVNEFSLNLRPEGRSAIRLLLSKGMETGHLSSVTQPIFNSDSL